MRLHFLKAAFPPKVVADVCSYIVLQSEVFLWYPPLIFSTGTPPRFLSTNTLYKLWHFEHYGSVYMEFLLWKLGGGVPVKKVTLYVNWSRISLTVYVSKEFCTWKIYWVTCTKVDPVRLILTVLLGSLNFFHLFATTCVPSCCHAWQTWYWTCRNKTGNQDNSNL